MPHTCPDPEFLASARTPDSDVFPLAGFDDWFARAVRRHHFVTEQIPFAKLEKWSFDPATGNLRHDTGRFFTVEGLSVSTSFDGERHWSQPILHQPEVGFLGIIARRIRGVLHFLMQAKMEPGNLNTIQLSPTLQATKSNYTRAHQGRTPRHLEHFYESRDRRVLADSLQSEQGGRFFRKRNRNIVIDVPEDRPLEPSEDHIWLTLGQIHRLLARDNVVNMDARTVLSTLSFHRDAAFRAPAEPAARHSLDHLISWFTEMKCRYRLDAHCIPLSQVTDWRKDEFRIHHPEGGRFEVIAMRIEAGNREVPAWTQPLVKPCAQGLLAFLVREFDGVPHLLVQARVESGNFDVVELAPTVQSLPGDAEGLGPNAIPHFRDVVLSAPPADILHDTLQSEEGGRFYNDQNRNLIVRAPADFPSDLPDHFRWITPWQLKALVRHSNVLNVQCRCLLACYDAGGAACPPPGATLLSPRPHA